MHIARSVPRPPIGFPLAWNLPLLRLHSFSLDPRPCSWAGRNALIERRPYDRVPSVQKPLPQLRTDQCGSAPDARERSRDMAVVAAKGRSMIPTVRGLPPHPLSQTLSSRVEVHAFAVGERPQVEALTSAPAQIVVGPDVLD